MAGETRSRRPGDADRSADVEALDALFAAIPVMMHSIDRAGQIRLVSDFWLQKMGFARAEVIGRPSTDFLTAESCKYAKEVILPAYFARGSCHEVPYQFVTKGGEILDVQLSAATLRDRDGQFMQSLAVIIDISEQTRAVQRQHQLEQELAHSQKMEAIGRLAGGVAHDFGNLLMALSSFGRRVLDALPPSTRVHSDMEQVLAAAKQAETLTRQLVTFARKETVSPTVLSANAVVSEMDKMLQRLLGEDVEFVTQLAPDLWNVCIDPGAIEQIVVNLAINARDAMPQGGKLRIDTANVLLAEGQVSGVPAGEYAMLAVLDTGQGMDAETRQRVFEPFFTTKDLAQGTGLGLSTCYAIVKQAKGHIAVESAKGKGSTFRIYLPHVERKTITPVAQKDISWLCGSETILVVEDNKSVESALVEMISRFGYRVLSATQPERALEIVEQRGEEIDLVLTDVVMPKLSGSELAHRIWLRWPQMRVLFMSGYTARRSTGERFPQEADCQLIQKPFSPLALALKLRDVLDTPLSDEVPIEK